MSSGGPSHTAPPPSDRGPVSLPRLAEMKEAGEPIVMVTAYDYPSAKVAEEAGVDIVLVGDYRGDGRPRLPRHRAGLDGGDDHARQGRAPWPARRR